jgi:hypothetical protein
VKALRDCFAKILEIKKIALPDLRGQTGAALACEAEWAKLTAGSLGAWGPGCGR